MVDASADPLFSGILGQYLGYQEKLLPVHAADGLPYQLFGQAVSVHFRGIDQCHSLLDPGLQGADLFLTGR